MSTLKITLAAGMLVVALAGCTKPAADNVAATNAVEADAMTTGAVPANDAMTAGNDGATDNSAVAANSADAGNGTDEDQASSGGVVLKQ